MKFDFDEKAQKMSKDIYSMTLDIVECDLDATEILNYVENLEKSDLYPFLSAFIVFDNTINEMRNKELKSKTRLFCDPPKEIQEIVDFYERKKALSFEITDAIKKRVGNFWESRIAKTY